MKLFFLLIISTFFMSNLAKSQIKIGIITDYEKNPKNEALISALLESIDKTTGAVNTVISPPEMCFYSVLENDNATEAYSKMKGVQMVIALGAVTTKALAQIDKLEIPVIGVGVFNPALQNIPYVNGCSGKNNFTYVWPFKDLKREIENFKTVSSFDSLTILVDPSIQKTVDQSKALDLFKTIADDLSIFIQPVVADQDLSTTINAIGKPQAILVSALSAMDEKYINSLSAYLIENKIPSYSILKRHVEQGVLSASSDENGWDQITKRIGLIADGILNGEDIAKQPVALSTKDKFYLNIGTAKKIGFSPPFDILFTANLLGVDDSGQKVYSFYEIADKALAENLDIKVSYNDIDLAALDIKSARAIVFPSLTSSLTGTQINEERANAAINSPERSLSADLTLQQVIYSPEVIAAIKISKYLQQAQVYKTQADVLNMLFNVYQMYLNVLTAKTNVAIQKKNLESTKTNLELANIRVQIGASNFADLYRWQSELAIASQTLIEAQTLLLSAKLQLNTLLANTLGDDFDIQDVDMNDNLFKKIKEGFISTMIRTPEDLKYTADFLVTEMLNQHPNKKMLAENINAAERQLALTKQLFYLPTFSLQAQTSQVLARGGEGSEVDPTDPTQLYLTGLQDNSWYVGAAISYPIFSGFSRRIDLKKSSIQLEQLNTSNQNLKQNLELAIRANMLSLLGASTNLNYSKVASESASKNFELIQSNYKSGTVNITQVIDAQQAAINADLAAAISNYEYITAYLKLEYSVGFFSMFSTTEELDAFRARFIEFISNR